MNTVILPRTEYRKILQNRRGFIGLLGLLIAVMIMAFLAVKVLSKMYTLPTSPESSDVNNSNEQTMPRSIIDSAENAARAIEARSRGD